MPDQNLGHRKSYIQTDKLYFLYVFSQVFKKQASNSKKERLTRSVSFHLYNRQFRPPKNKCVAQYVIWLFDTCEINISNLIFPKGFFKESNELSGSDKLRWDLFSWRLNKATLHGKPINMRSISFEYNIDEASQKTNEYLDSYLNRIENDQITSASHYIAFKKQREEIINKIKEKHLKTGKDNVFFELEENEYPKGICR